MEFPYPGISTFRNKFGIFVVRLSYEADPTKGQPEAEHIWVEEQKMKMSPWLYKEYMGMTDKSLFRQEYLIDFSARLGQLVYQMDGEATLVNSSELPDEGTDYFALDPHERRPFYGLWGRVDRWDNLWIYREYWPSKAYGVPGNIPEDDNRHSIKDYVETCWWLESDQNPDNKGVHRYPYFRVIDYAARAQGQGSMDDPETLNFQQRIQKAADEIAEKNDKNWDMRFQDAKKDVGAGVETVNEYLKPRMVRHAVEDKWMRRSKLLICQDTCPELVYEMQNVRWQTLTPTQAEMMDPTGKPIKKRDNATDCARYLCMANPEYIEPRKIKSTWRPVVDGIAR